MDIIYHDTQPPSSVPPSWQAVSINTLFKSSDILTLHCPLTPETHEIVDIHHLKRMKKTAFLINTSRGGLIKSRDLAEALKGGVIQGAGLDVLDQEPPTADHPLIGIPNCFITPHIAWATRAARERLLKTAIENLKAYMHGKAIHVVTP
jgi:glycerate dehydrogenase